MRPARQALTLIELVVVLLILVAVAALVIPQVTFTTNRAREQVVYARLASIREVIVGTARQPGFYSHLPQKNPATRLSKLDQLYRPDSLPEQFRVYNPASRLGWSGPYLNRSSSAPYVIDGSRNFSTEYGDDLTNDLAPVDPYGTPAEPCFIVLQDRGAGYEGRLVSAGPNRIIDCDSNITTAAGLTNRGDDIVLFLSVRDPLAKDFLNQ